MILLLVCVQGCSSKAEEPNVEAVQEPKKMVTLDLGNGVTMELMLIRPGSFMMGDNNGFSDEKPPHKVTITKPFYIGKYEVTQKQWEAVMGNNPSNSTGPQNPVENVSWEDCQAFLKKIEEKFSSTGANFSLPSEAQWEYACRAGSTTMYSFGGVDKQYVLRDYAWLSGNSQEHTHPVGEKKPNAWGLYDMYGNVEEWCTDWYDAGYYKQSPPEDPKGPSAGADRVLRGGNYFSGISMTSRSSNRNHRSPSERLPFFGFRVVYVH